MKKYRSAVGAAVFALRLAGCAALTLCLVQCSAEEQSEVASENENVGSVQQALEACGGRSCSGHNDCKINVPVCAVVNTAYCLTIAPNECVWKIDTTNNACRCIEHDIRLCTLPGTGAPGVQICTATSSTSAQWGTCATCPSCS